MGHESGAGSARTLQDLEHCLLLIRAPSDRVIYEAFRAAARASRRQIEHEQLWIDGNVPLTAGLSAPTVPPTIERLLEADCEMIDKLALQVGELRIIYLRSGGHAPYRESFFDEMHLELPEHAAFERNEIAHVLEELCRELSVSSHTGTPLFEQLLRTRDS